MEIRGLTYKFNRKSSSYFDWMMQIKNDYYHTLDAVIVMVPGTSTIGDRG